MVVFKVLRLFFLLVLFAPALALAGTVFETVTTEANGAQSNGTISVQDANLSMQIRADGQDMTIIYKHDLAEIVAVNHAEKSYMVLDQALMEQVSAQLAAAKQQMEAMLSAVPPEQRAMVEKMMEGRLPQLDAELPVIDVVKQGSGEAINGKSTERYQVTYNGAPRENFWVVDWAEFEGADELRESFFGLADFMQSIYEDIPMLAANMENPLQAIKEVNGLPIRTQYLNESGQVETTTDIVSSKSQTIDAAAFQAPADYTKQSLPSFP